MAGDYRPHAAETTQFFQAIQNKLHFAATCKTAAELIASRADHTKPNMGLTAWKGGAVRKGDTTIAKNYLREEEISELNRIVVMWLDFAEDQAKRRKDVFLKDWGLKLDQFLALNERRILEGAGRMSKPAAEAKAEVEYEQFAAQRRAYLEAEAERDATAAMLRETKKLRRKGGGATE